MKTLQQYINEARFEHDYAFQIEITSPACYRRAQRMLYDLGVQWLMPMEERKTDPMFVKGVRKWEPMDSFIKVQFEEDATITNETIGCFFRSANDESEYLTTLKLKGLARLIKERETKLKA